MDFIDKISAKITLAPKEIKKLLIELNQFYKKINPYSRERYVFTQENLEDTFLDEIIEYIQDTKNIALDLDGYAYTPMNASLTKWKASDGSILNIGLISLISDYASDSKREEFLYVVMDRGAEEFAKRFVIKEPIGQAEYEESKF